MSDGGGIGTPSGLGGGVEIGPADGPGLPYVPADHSGDPARDRQTSRGLDKSKSARDDEPDAKDEASRQGKSKKKLEATVDRAFAKGKAGKGEARDAVGADHSQPPRDLNLPPEARADWAKVPERVQAQVYRRFGELENGIHQYRARAVRDSQLDGWHQAAAQARTTVPAYLQQVTAIEAGLRSADPALKALAIERVLATANVSPAEYANFVFGDTAEARHARMQSLQMQAMSGQIAQVGRATADVAFSQMQNTVRQDIQSTVLGFASGIGADHFEDISADLAAAISADPDKSGSTTARLQRAYDSIKGRRRAGKSIHGSPANGSDPSLPAKRKGGSIDDSLNRAFSRAGV